MRIASIAFYSLVCVSFAAYADGPADLVPTNPHQVVSATGPASAPLPVDALLTTTRISGVARSNNGRKLAYTSSASGRPNLWIMNVDGAEAQQLVTNNDRQLGARFTHDDSAVVYSQDSGGNEYYDIYVVPATGGTPKNLTNTPDVSETVDEFSPDGKLLAIGVKQKTTPSTESRRHAVARRHNPPAHARNRAQGLVERGCLEPRRPLPLRNAQSRDRRCGHLSCRCCHRRYREAAGSTPASS